MSTIPSSPDARWAAFTQQVEDICTLGGVLGLIEWDQQVVMPAGSGNARAAQSSLLSRVHHEHISHPRVGELARAVLEDAQAAEMISGAPPLSLRDAAARQVLRDHTRALAVPVELVGRMARVRAAGFHAWREAREADDMSLFAPALAEVVATSRETAACYGDVDHPYDAALDAFEPGATVATLAPMFARLGKELAPLVAAAADKHLPAPLDLHVSDESFGPLNDYVLDAMGYDRSRGRLDLAAHPFTVGIHPEDVRITTRLFGDDPLNTLGSTIHECGHALYEQGLPAHLFSCGLASAASAGLHESQSRFWENHIGRSLPFLQWLAPALEKASGKKVNPARLYAAANQIQPGLIRVSADEATYNLHIIVRFELEVALFSGALQVSELSDAWNDAYQRLLGVRPPSDKDGVLQDIHWSSGYFGYFPSYTLGNLYAAGFGVAVSRDIPDVWEHVARGNFADILQWLRTRVHVHGRSMNATEVYRDAVGNIDPVDALVEHLYARQGALLGLSRP